MKMKRAERAVHLSYAEPWEYMSIYSGAWVSKG